MSAALKSWKEIKIRPSLNTRLLWSLLAAITVIDALLLQAQGMSVVPRPVLNTGAQAVFLLLLSFFYTYFRPDTRLAALTHITAAYFTSLIALSILSYATVAWQRPLIDEAIVGWDHALGLDWVVFYNWVEAHPLIHKILFIAYASLIPQLTVLLLLLNFFNLTQRWWEMLWMFIAATLGCILFAAVWPAVGAFGHFHIEEDRGYVRTFMALYDGTMKVIGSEPIEGLVQFPSLHVGLAIIFTYCARGLRYVFPAFIILNVLLFISTAPIGGHHFADLWGGLLLALASIYAVKTVPKLRRTAS